MILFPKIKVIKPIVIILIISIGIFGQTKPINYPKIVYSPKPEYVDLYNKAWKLALEHVKYQDGLPQSPYVDEAFDENTIWIWDTAFMLLFYKYTATEFSAIETFNNFYAPIHNDFQLPK